MIIRRNMASLRTFRESGRTQTALTKNLEKLSSGLQINRAGDDAAGLAISEKMRSEITEMNRCQSNVMEGLDLARTADGALEEINNMLRRARGLCIEAANGTYSEQERASISDELNQLFSEIDRITVSSKHNSIPLFRGDISEHYHDVYDEIYNELGSSQVEKWGTMEFVPETDFSPAPPAQPAMAEFTLSSDIDLADKSTLEGKSITINGYTYHFTSNPNSTPKNWNVDVHINLNNYNSAKDALLSLKGEHRPVNFTSNSDPINDISDISIDEATRTVTLTATLGVLYDAVADKDTPNANGEIKNGTMVQNPEGDQALGQVDNLGASNNQVVYQEGIGKFTLNFNNLSQTQFDNLNQNSFYVYSNTAGNAVAIKFSDLNLTLNESQDSVGGKLAAAIHNANGAYQTAYSNGILTVTVDNGTGTAPIYAYMREQTQSGNRVDGTPFTGASLGISSAVIQQGTLETRMKVQITVPSPLPDAPFSFQLGGKSYLYYNSGDYDSAAYPYLSSSAYYTVNIKGMSASEIQNNIMDKVKNYANSLPGKSSVERNGNAVIITAASNQTVNVTVGGTAITATPYNPNASAGSSAVLNSNLGSNYVYFSQNAEVSFDLGSNIADLVGSGFCFGSSRIEFTNGSGKVSSYPGVDISNCQNMQEVVNAVKAVLPTSYSAVLTGSKMTISTNKSTGSSSYLTVTDGAGGIMDGGPVKFSGGTIPGYSQTTLDFSSINADNLDTLLGKGFRIDCATCKGEYINVFFCWENDGTMPEQFQRWDEVENETRTIHNIPVELSKVTSGDKIVESIVNQVKPSLNHFTDVDIGDPPTMLIARDKRIGGFVDTNGVLLPGRVESGMETNFTYSVEFVRKPDLPEDGSVKLYTTDIQIYAGSTPEPQYIPVHLPYIDLEWLRLTPPDKVDLNEEAQDAADWLTRVDCANIAISDARGTLGADYNRLERAFKALAEADEQLSDAESRIRDADMAKLMMENTKLQILSQSQRSIMAQANVQPQQILKLLA